MRQRGDFQLIDLLNNVRIADIKSTCIELLYSRVIEPQYDQYPHDPLHIFVENENASNHNLKMLRSIESNQYIVTEIDLLRKNIPCQKINEVLNRVPSETV